MADPLDDEFGGSRDLARIVELIAHRVAPALERIAAALEALPSGVRNAAVIDPRQAPLSEIREAIRAKEFARAGTLLDDLQEAGGDPSDAARLREEFDEARRLHAIDQRARLDAARGVNDPIAALNHRDALAGLLDFEEAAALDRDLARWLMMLLMKRMRSGTVREDVASLAARGAESFGHLPEGASLRAALPTLRRSAGQCPRCASPYGGDEDACEKCLASAPKIADLPVPSPAT